MGLLMVRNREWQLVLLTAGLRMACLRVSGEWKSVIIIVMLKKNGS